MSTISVKQTVSGSYKWRDVMKTTLIRSLTLACGITAFGFVGAPEANAGDRWNVNVSVGNRGCTTTRVERVWVPPVYEDRWVEYNIPAVIETRRIKVYDSCGRFVGYKRVEQVIEPARIERRLERVLVREGFYEEVIVESPRRSRDAIRVANTGHRGNRHRSVNVYYEDHHDRRDRKFKKNAKRKVRKALKRKAKKIRKRARKAAHWLTH